MKVFRVPHTHSTTRPSSIILPVDKRYENIIVLKQFMEFQKKLGFPRKIAVIFVKAEIWSINHQNGRIIGFQLLNAVFISSFAIKSGLANMSISKQ